MVQIKVLRDRHEVGQLADQWNRVAQEFPFYRHEWMVNWLLEMGTEFEPRVVAVSNEQNEWIGFAPFAIHPTSIGGRTMELIASGQTCSDYIGIAALPGCEQEVVAAIAGWLHDSRRSQDDRFDTLVLEGIASNCPKLAQLKSELSRFGFQFHEEEIEGGWEVSLPGTWEDFESSLKKSVRRKTRKAGKRLMEPTTFVRTSATDPQGLDAVWDSFVELHQLRRQSLGQPGCFANPRFHMFLKLATRDLVAAGLGELAVLESFGRPFASMLLFNDGQAMYMYQSGMHPDFAKEEPGYQMIVWAIRRAIEQGLKRFDFLRGDEPYKARWNTERRPMQRVRISAPHMAARFRHQVWLSGKVIKNCFFPTEIGG